MKIGAMNDPYKSVLTQLDRFADAGFEYLDLTVEEPEASPKKLRNQKQKILDWLSTKKWPVIGHICWFLPYAHPYEKIRAVSINEITEAIDTATEFGAKAITIHPDLLPFVYRSRDQYLARTKEALVHLSDHVDSHGAQLLLEPYDEPTLGVEEVKQIFAELPKLGFHIDIGHANIMRPRSQAIGELLAALGSRLKHVHASDNDGKADQHLPIGAGKIKWSDVCKQLKKIGYDGTVTLEIHSPDEDYLKISLEKFRKIWGEA